MFMNWSLIEIYQPIFALYDHCSIVLKKGERFTMYMIYSMLVWMPYTFTSQTIISEYLLHNTAINIPCYKPNIKARLLKKWKSLRLRTSIEPSLTQTKVCYLDMALHVEHDIVQRWARKHFVLRYFL